MHPLPPSEILLFRDLLSRSSITTGKGLSICRDLALNFGIGLQEVRRVRRKEEGRIPHDYPAIGYDWLSLPPIT